MVEPRVTVAVEIVGLVALFEETNIWIQIILDVVSGRLVSNARLDAGAVRI